MFITRVFTWKSVRDHTRSDVVLVQVHTTRAQCYDADLLELMYNVASAMGDPRAYVILVGVSLAPSYHCALWTALRPVDKH